MLDAFREFIDTYLQGRLTSLIDIAVVAVLIYGLFVLIRGTRALQIVIGLSVLYALYLVAQFFELRLISTLLQTGAVVGLFAIVVVFQPELRRALEQIGRVGSVNRLFAHRETSVAERMAREISRAARLLAESRHGALIVLERETGLHDVTAESGIVLNADLSAELLLSVFYPRSPLHDGAIVVTGTKVVAAGVLLPLSSNVLDTGRYGTRHRAAIGISEQTDAVVVVVSEETGSISLVRQGRIERNLTEEGLRRRLLNLFRPPTARTAVPLLRRTIEGRWLTRDNGGAPQASDEERVVGEPPPAGEATTPLAPVAGERRR